MAGNTEGGADGADGVGKGAKVYSEMGRVSGPVSVATEVA